ncbi:MAG: four helix bundle protein [Deltaproteobacteria bacterium]|jgi:four helix bundle protein|nr:four helix bundle protein [Deltaproteobacteria bacterium]MBW2535308.1 four helix bundle protein [Deltaproteobacteria bacterium]
MQDGTFHFTHYELIAFHVAQELADLVMVIAPQVPEGHAKMVDQIVRAATGAEALVAEGANRYTPKQKRQRFVEARGEAGEVAAHLERLRRYRFISEAQLHQGLGLADRLCALLTGLIRRHS